MTTVPIGTIGACDGWNTLSGDLTVKTWGQYVFEKMRRVQDFIIETMSEISTETDSESTVTETDEGIETLNSYV